MSNASDSNLKPLVVVVGGTGITGLSILKGLAKAGEWNLAVTLRPGSVDKPEVSTLRDLGVEIRLSNFLTDTPAQLDEALKGAEIVISACFGTVIHEQTRLVDAIKRIGGVKRFIPSNWATPAPRGAMGLRDAKYKIQDYIKEQGVPYTIIDMGFWMTASIPYKSGPTSLYGKITRTFYDSEHRSAMVNPDHIGDFVARIIADPRTLNQYVFAYEDELSLKEIYELCSQAAGEDFRSIQSTTSLKQLEENAANSGGDIFYEKFIKQYLWSIWGRGDNCVKTAKSLGALDVKELYPDMKYQALAEFVQDFY